MSQFKFSCPHCDQHLQCDEQASGLEFQCPNCQHLIRIPPFPAEPPSSNPNPARRGPPLFLPGTCPRQKGYRSIMNPNADELVEEKAICPSTPFFCS